MSQTAAPRALLAAPAKPGAPASQMIVDVARKYGVSPITQFGQMIRLWAGRNRLQFHDYYSFGVYRKDLTSEAKCEFVGKEGSFRLNNRLSPAPVTPLREFVRDKLLYGAMLESLGFATPAVQAVASRLRSHGRVPTLRSVEQIEGFLLTQARYPLFVKPEKGSGSVGSALVSALDETHRELVFSNGKRVDLRAFATEALEDHAAGLLFQDAVIQHGALSDVAGRAVGSIRVVTVMAGDTPSVLYTLWKVPSPNAMSDNYWQDGSMIAEIDSDTGIIRQCRRGAGPAQETITHHPVSGMEFAGFQIPHWDAVRHLTREAHSLMPDFGVFGWDIAITDDGPLIIECNVNPHHTLYQLATGQGLLNQTIKPVLDRAEKRSEDLRQRLKAAALSEHRKNR